KGRRGEGETEGPVLSPPLPFSPSPLLPFSTSLIPRPARSPFHAQHQAVEAAADAEEADAVAGQQEAALLGEGGRQRQRHGTDVAQVRERRVILVARDAEGFEDGVAMAAADLVADDLVHGVGGPAEPGEERLPGAQAEFDAKAED